MATTSKQITINCGRGNTEEEDEGTCLISKLSVAEKGKGCADSYPWVSSIVYHLTCFVSVTHSDEHIIPSFPRTSAPTQCANNSAVFSS